MIDFHCHYSGCLDLNFIWSQLCKRVICWENKEAAWKAIFPQLSYKEFLNKTPPERKSIKKFLNYRFAHLFKNNNAVENLNIFFQVYRFIQNVTKSKDIEEQSELYFLGAKSIAETYACEGIEHFELRIGPRKRRQETFCRLESMIRGFSSIEKKYKLPRSFSRIVFTFIQDDSGEFVNLTENSFLDLIDTLKDNPEMDKRVVGIDFSGPELNKKHPLIMKVIREVKKYNLHRRKRGKNVWEIMAHAGEDLYRISLHEHLENINRLIAAGVNRISHGTALWIPPKYLSKKDQRDTIKRKNILLELSGRKIVLEICPSANLILSPLRSYSEIPLPLFRKIGLKYTINTDNKTIFSTNLQRELENCAEDK